MNYQEFYNEWKKHPVFSINEVYAWDAGFNKNNLTRWVIKGYLIRLLNGFYSFPEYQDVPNIYFHIANKIYQPSYISLQTALAFYGLIPEAVVSITSVSTKKTYQTQNQFGNFYYQKIKESAFFGYDLKKFLNNSSIKLAKPEKAIVDFLYLNPFINNEQEIVDLRMDDDIFEEIIDLKVVFDFAEKMKNKSLIKRLKILSKVMSYD